MSNIDRSGGSRTDTNSKLDPFGKVTVSLGGHCPLDCAHCYTVTSAFGVDQKRSATEAIDEVRRHGDPNIICLSGDTDPFLRPAEALDFLERAAEEFPHCDLMYTTRLIPAARFEDRLVGLGNELATKGRRFVGAVSVATLDFPNAIEDARRVPDSEQRLKLLERLSAHKQPVMMALRPTFPFNVVSRSEVDSLLRSVPPAVNVVLGEILLLDTAGEIAERLRIPATHDNDVVGKLTFLRQPSSWRKRYLPEETTHARHVCELLSKQYFLRSISAMRYFRSYWNLARGSSAYSAGDPLDLSAEEVAP